jgi:hypothetical protein
VAATVLAASTLALAPLAKPAEAAFPGQNGKIFFESTRDGNAEIYSMDQDGKNQTPSPSTRRPTSTLLFLLTARR